MITTLGLGAWAIGGPWKYGWGNQDDRDSIRTIHRALERGMNWIDTAPAYGLGHSEEIVARALDETSFRPLIFTKCGIVWNSKREPSFRIDRQSIEREVEDSLRRLKVDVIDLYQVHWPMPENDIEEAWSTMARLKEKGNVRYIGVSNFSVEQMERVRSIAEITSLQPPFSLVDRSAADKILPYCLENGIGVINYSPMASGLLTGKMTRDRIQNLPPDDWRRKSEEFKEPKLSRNLELVELLRGLAADHRCTVAEIAIAWTLCNPAVTGAIVGLRNPDQIDGIIGAHEVRFSDSELKRIEQFLQKDEKS